MESMLSVSVCVCAFNEQRNIERAIRSVFSQTADGFEIEDVIVVSSGSTDDTDTIVKGLMNEFPVLELIRQEEREGKNSAINEFLDIKKGNVCVFLNADNVLHTDLSLYHLVSPFRNEKIGMVGGRPIPTNDPKDRVGFAVHMIWTMHHHVSMRVPKIGELVAFRDPGIRLPTTMQSDEDLIKMELEKNGYVSVYVPDAVVLNHGPETAEDFLEQRIRVNIGEEYIRKKYGYSVPTHDKRLLFRALLGCVRDLGVHPIKMFSAIRLENRARRAAKAHVESKKDDVSVWSPVESTKDLK